nr:hypothetical protein Iba_chr01aCG9840 [Ipomoea batatas]
MAMDFRSGYLKAQTSFISGCWSLFLINGSSVDDRWRWILDLEVGVCLSDFAMIGFDWWRRETERDDEAEHRLPRLKVGGRRSTMDGNEFSIWLPQSSNRVTNFISGGWSLFLMNGSSVDNRLRWILDLEVGVCFSDLAIIGSDWWEAMFGEERENGEAECRS